MRGWQEVQCRKQNSFSDGIYMCNPAWGRQRENKQSTRVVATVIEARNDVARYSCASLVANLVAVVFFRQLCRIIKREALCLSPP